MGGTQSDEEVRTALESGQQVIWNDGGNWASFSAGKVYTGCFIEDCEGCSDIYDSIDEFLQMLKY